MLMDEKPLVSIDQAKEAALRILLHNARGPFKDCRGPPGGVTRSLTRGTS